jgi:heme exporter protein C
MKQNAVAWRLAWLATAIVLAVAGYAIFFVAPRELTMGDIQRIFYFHASSGMLADLAFFISFLGCVGYLASRQPKWDWMAVAAAEVALAFNTVVLITGPIWARPVWGVWWTWDARLTLQFVLELLYVAYLLLRVLVTEPDRRAMISAVFGIFAFLDVPLSYFSIRWWRTLHPQPVIGGGPGSGLDPRMWQVFLLASIGLLALIILMIRDRYRLEKARWELAEMSAEIEASEQAMEMKEVSR